MIEPVTIGRAMLYDQIMGEFASQTALAGRWPRATLRCLGLSALIAFAAACAPHKAPEAKHGAYLVIAQGEFGELDAICDRGRLVYLMSGGRGDAIAVVPNAPDCDGDTYVAEAAAK